MKPALILWTGPALTFSHRNKTTRRFSIMPDEIQLTQKQQLLMEFLNELVTAPLTPEALERGNQLLDDAAEECRQQQDSLRQEQGDTSDG
jgi:hypothetical protein